MCGIAGLLRLDGGTLQNAERTRAMSAALLHRGPDAEGHWQHGPAAFGFRRLAVIDLGTGDQPMSDGALTVMQNGEIYNYLELRAELEGLGHRFRTRSDTEILLHGYRAWGAGLLDRLRGMYAFALFDADKSELLLVRDRIGQKPLFWQQDPAAGELRFASSLYALLPALGERRLDYQALDDYLTFSVIPGPRSALAGVHKLPPAHLLRVTTDPTGGRLQGPARYWRPPTPSTADTGTASPELLRETLEESVRLRLRSDVPVGSFLSGGVDSTLITALAAKHHDSLETFTVGFGDPRFDESPVAARTAERLGTHHHEERLEATDFSPDELVKLIPLMDEPFGDSSFLPTYWLSSVARRRVTVALSGDGGDELFAGYTRYRTFLRLQRLAHVPGLALAERSLALWNRSASWQRRLAKACRIARRDEASRLLGLLTYFDEDDKDLLLSEDLRRIQHGSLATLTRQLEDLPADLSGLDRFLQRDLAASLVDDALVKVDRASMACSLEVRSPLLDHRVVELAMRIPARQKLRGRESKAILKRAFADLLPDEVRYGAKKGFEVPFGAWFARPDWRDWLIDTLSPDRLRRQGHFRADAVVTLRDQLLADPEARGLNISAYQLRHRVWMLALFQLWHDGVLGSI